MGLGQTVLLGLIAGSTILLGLPVGRLRQPAPGLRVMLNAVAIGILLFLVWDVLSEAWDPIDAALTQLHNGHGGLGAALGYGAVFVVGTSLGLLPLVYYERWMGRRVRRLPTASPEVKVPFGPGTAHVDEISSIQAGGWSRARTLAFLIAIGIGLHNFAEGLAIGQSAANSEIALATMLVIGFGLHNATEGFGIVAPLAGDRAPDGAPLRPSWWFLLMLGLVAGGPTFVGTVVGHTFASAVLSVLFLTLAAGSIVYVVIQLLGVAAKAKRPELLAFGLLLGLFAGFLTDALVSVAGA